MGYVFPPHDPVTLPVAGSDDRLPVRRILCVGRNYAAHAREMGKDPDRDPPFFFSKPADAVVMDGETVAYSFDVLSPSTVTVTFSGNDGNNDVGTDGQGAFSGSIDLNF